MASPSEHPVAADNDPYEQEDGEESLTAIAFLISLLAMLVILTSETHADKVNSCLKEANAAKDNEEDRNQN